MHPLGNHARASARTSSPSSIMKLLLPSGSTKQKRYSLRACQACRQPVRLIVELADGFFNPERGLRPDRGAPVQHPVNGCNAKTGLKGHVLNGNSCHAPYGLPRRNFVNS